MKPQIAYIVKLQEKKIKNFILFASMCFRNFCQAFKNIQYLPVTSLSMVWLLEVNHGLKYPCFM